MSFLNSIVFAPPWLGGGTKSLYVACEALDTLGRCTIAPFGDEPCLAGWFRHHCQLYDYTYLPDLVVYPEVYQPQIAQRRHICFFLGKYGQVKPHADLTVCRSRELVRWGAEHNSRVPMVLLLPGIDREIFEYDGREKHSVICYMTRPHKHPETAQLLRERYPGTVVEIIERHESEVAELLKAAKVFVWRGTNEEGSPRPPKEALVAGCVVVGLKEDLTASYHTDFGLRCATVEELIETAGQALSLPIPTFAERLLIRDVEEEKNDWVRIVTELMGL